MSTYAQSIQFLLSQVRRAAGSLEDGTVTAYAAGTTNLKTIWLDRGKQTEADNPYTLDANGTAQLFGDGLYRFVIKSSSGTTVYDRDYISIKDMSTLAYDVSDYASLAAACAALNGTGATLQFSTGQTLSSNLTTDVELVPVNGAVINRGAYSFTYNGSTSRWPDMQVLSGTGSVVLNQGTAIKTVWFGDKDDGLTASASANTAAVNAALVCASASKVKLVVAAPGTHYFNASIVFPGDRITLEGAATLYAYEDRGTAGVTFMWTGSGVDKGIDLGSYPTQNYNTIRNIRVHGNSLVDRGIYSAGTNVIQNCQVLKTQVAGIQLGNYTNMTVVDMCVLYQNNGDGIQVKGPLTTVFTVSRTTSEANTGNGFYAESFSFASVSDSVFESNGMAGIKIYVPAPPQWASGLTFKNVYAEANGGEYQIDIDAHVSVTYAPGYLKFKETYVTAPEGSGAGRKYIRAANCYRPEFQGGYFTGGDPLLTYAQKITVTTSDSLTWFSNVGGSGASGVTNAKSVNLSNTFRVEGTSLGAGPNTSVWSGGMYSFDTGSMAAGTKKKFTIPADVSGMMIVTEATGASANHRRAVGIFDKNTGTLDMTDITDSANIIAVAADFSGIELTNVAAGASAFTVVFIGRSVGSITMN